MAVRKIDEQVDVVTIGIVKDWGKARSTTDFQTFFKVFGCFYGGYAANFIITFDHGDFMLVVFDNAKDFLHGLLKFFVANTAAHIKGYGDFSLITSQFTPQVQAVWLSAVAAGCRFLSRTSYCSQDLLEVQVPGKFAFMGGESL